MEKSKIKVIRWGQEGVKEEPDYVYRLDDEEAAKRFFKNVLDNAEIDGREQFAIEEMTEKQFAEAVKWGEVSA